MQGTSGLFGSLLGHASGVFLLAVAAGIAAAAVAGWLGTVAHRRPDLFEPSLCAAVTLSLFASPHLLGHDLTLLAPVLIAGVAWLAGRPGERPWPGSATVRVLAIWALLSFASLGDLSQNTVGCPGRATPWVLLLMAAAWCFLVVRAASSRAGGRATVARPVGASLHDAG
jgi:hypothetical protein